MTERLARSAVEALRPDGRLFALEPTLRPGLLGRLRISAAVARPEWTARHELTAVLRAAGFVLYNIERFALPRPGLPLWTFVQVEAAPRPDWMRT